MHHSLSLDSKGGERDSQDCIISEWKDQMKGGPVEVRSGLSHFFLVYPLVLFSKLRLLCNLSINLIYHTISLASHELFRR